MSHPTHRCRAPASCLPAPRSALLVCLLIAMVVVSPRLRGADCNGNGVDDVEDIAAGTSVDANGDGTPDACERLQPWFGRARVIERYEPGTIRDALAADFDSDGSDELAVALAGGAIDILTLTADGGLGRHQLVASEQLEQLAAGDFNGDGALDLLGLSGERWHYRGRGDGTFDLVAQERTFPHRGLAVGDADGDGRDDLAAIGPSSRDVTLLRSREDGTFEAEEVSLPGAMVSALALVDLDGDGRGELVASDRATASLLVLRRLDDGSGYLPPRGIPVPVPFVAANSLLAADFDGDRREDVVWVASRVYTFANSGNGDLALTATFRRSIQTAAAHDLDGDGDLDLAATVDGLRYDDTMEEAAVFLNRGDGSFATEQILHGRTPEPRLVVGDFDGRGGADIALLSGDGTVHRLSANDFSRDFGEIVEFDSRYQNHEIPGSGGSRYRDPLARDIDGEGSIDLLVERDADHRNFLLRNDGTGEFAAPVEVRLPAYDRAVVDWDVDGDLDVIGNHSWFDPRRGVYLALNQGDATFELDLLLEERTLVDIGDLDRDGRADLLINEGPREYASYLRGPDGSLTIVPIQSPIGRTHSLMDIDSDGFLDLVALTESGLQAFPGRGDGTFGVDDARRLPAGGEDFALGDVNGDGHQDLALVPEGGRVRIFLGDGQGGFGPPSAELVLDERSQHESIAMADLLGDGTDEILVVNLHALHVIYPRGGGLYQVTTVAAGQARPPLIGDVDGDHDLDLIASVLPQTHVLINGTADLIRRAALEEIVTERDFFSITVPASDARERRGSYLLDLETDAVTFPNARRFETARQALAGLFPERYGDLDAAGFEALALRRATRTLAAGELRLIPAGADRNRWLWGFDIATASADDPAEAPTPEEVERVFGALSGSIALRPLVYAPRDEADRTAARALVDSAVPLYLGEPLPVFVRGDCDGNGRPGEGADVLVVLAATFGIAATRPPCLAACDVDGDGQVGGSVTDAVYLLAFRFLGAAPPPPPFPACDVSLDAGDAQLGCETPAEGCGRCSGPQRLDEPKKAVTGV